MRWFCSTGLACALLAVTATAADRQASTADFQKAFPDVRMAQYRADGQISTVYGPAFGFGASPEEVAAEFLMNHAGMFGAEPQDLEPVSFLRDAQHTIPLMYQRDTGEYKFTLVFFSQYRNGIPVYNSDVRLLVRNEPGFPLVLVRNGLRDLGDFQPDGDLSPRYDLIENAILADFPNVVNFSDARKVVWVDQSGEDPQPYLAVVQIVDNGQPATEVYEKYEVISDAVTGQVLHVESRIHNVDVNGNVSGNWTLDGLADACGPEGMTTVPYGFVQISGGNSAYADVNGDFTISNGGSSPVTVTAEMRGRYFAVNNQSGAELTAQATVTPPGPANLVLNPSPTELTTAQMNGYVHANIVRDWTLAGHPTYPTIWNQTNWPVNVNIASTCNAYYDYSSINFYRSGGGCNNTAFSDVVYHEYGHHMVAEGGSSQGQYGEGSGDVNGVIILDRSQLGVGFQSCSTGIRDADNNMQYPCSGPIHTCGQLLSGCVWSTRNELIVTNPGTYSEILRDLWVNSIPMHGFSDTITPDITIDWLTIDDDNGNINDGTPHYPEICAGFGAHNMDCPPLQLLGFDFPNGLPDSVNPNGGTTVRVEVYGISAQPQVGSGKAFYDTGSGFVEGTMNQVSDNVYDAVFPADDCGDSVRFYFSARTTTNQLVTSPNNAPANSYSTVAAFQASVIYADDFNGNQGWTVQNQNVSTGAWTRAIPSGSNGQRGDPADDFDGSGFCFVTGNGFDEDLDGGPTRLLSPVMDMSEPGAYVISYARWFVDDTQQDDLLVVEVNNGSGWVNVANVQEFTGWQEASFIVGNYVTPTATVQVRFTASDNPNNSVYEAAIDAFEVLHYSCEAEFAQGDMNCDGAVDGADIEPFFLAIGDPGGYAQQYPNCNLLNADMNGDQSVDGADIDPFFDCLGNGNCP